MNRQKKINKLKNEIEKHQRVIQGHQMAIDKLESKEDIKLGVLYTALDGIKTINKGYTSQKIKIALELIEIPENKKYNKAINCTVTSVYVIDNEKQKIIKTYLSDLFEETKVTVTVIEEKNN